MTAEGTAPPINVAIVEDDAEIREMLSRIVRRTPQFALLGAFPDAETALAAIPNLAPDVMVMDLQLPGMSGIDCIRVLKQKLPAIQVLVFTVFSDSDLVFRALEAGASGYLLKRTARRDVVEAIEQVWGGGAPMTGEIARMVVDSFRRVRPSLGPSRQLTPREEEVLGLLAKGYVTKEVADALSLSSDTVRFHLKHVYEKLHVHSRTEALIKYLQ
ncbi:MAG: response regulator transcription factor [Opitutaceae bacterium]|jgi:DNA-binding NarL/FixJ family response regulator